MNVVSMHLIVSCPTHIKSHVGLDSNKGSKFPLTIRTHVQYSQQCVSSVKLFSCILSQRYALTHNIHSHHPNPVSSRFTSAAAYSHTLYLYSIPTKHDQEAHTSSHT